MGAVRNAVGICCGATSSKLSLSDHAARSIWLTTSVAGECLPTIDFARLAQQVLGVRLFLSECEQHARDRSGLCGIWLRAASPIAEQTKALKELRAENERLQMAIAQSGDAMRGSVYGRIHPLPDFRMMAGFAAAGNFYDWSLPPRVVAAINASNGCVTASIQRLSYQSQSLSSY
jgi:hypothetical protein